MFKTMKRFKVVNYTRILGSKEEGFTIQKTANAGSIVLDSKLSESQITSKLINIGVLGSNDTHDRFSFDTGFEEFIMIEGAAEEIEGYPVCRLEYIEDVTVFSWFHKVFVLPPGYSLETEQQEGMDVVTGILDQAEEICVITEDLLTGNIVLIGTISPSVVLEEV